MNRENYCKALESIISVEKVSKYILCLIKTYKNIEFINEKQTICRDKNRTLEIIVDKNNILVLNKSNNKSVVSSLEYEILSDGNIRILFEKFINHFDEKTSQNDVNSRLEEYLYNSSNKLIESKKREIEESFMSRDGKKIYMIPNCFSNYIIEEEIYQNGNNSYKRHISSKQKYNLKNPIDEYQISNTIVDNALEDIKVYDEDFKNIVDIKSLILNK